MIIKTGLSHCRRMIMKINTYYRFCELCFHYGRNWDKLATDKEHAIEFGHRYVNQEPEIFQKGTLHRTMEYVIAHCAESINERLRQEEKAGKAILINKLLI